MSEHLYELDDVSDELVAAVPPRIREGIDNFVWFGKPTGGFLRAVLTNDLMEAIGRADEESLAAIRPICQYVYNAVPSVCHGSPEAVNRQLFTHGEENNDHRQPTHLERRQDDRPEVREGVHEGRRVFRYIG